MLRSLRKEQAPSITFFGANDGWLKGWEKVSEKLKDLGHSGSEQWFAEGEGHSFFNKEPWRTLTLLAADRFWFSAVYSKANPRKRHRPDPSDFSSDLNGTFSPPNHSTIQNLCVNSSPPSLCSSLLWPPPRRSVPM